MKIKLRGKVWKQITLKEFKDLELNNGEIALFEDTWGEKTYFKLISQKEGKKI